MEMGYGTLHGPAGVLVKLPGTAEIRILDAICFSESFLIPIGCLQDLAVVDAVVLIWVGFNPMVNKTMSFCLANSRGITNA
jgi:hypothetical protein